MQYIFHCLLQYTLHDLIHQQLHKCDLFQENTLHDVFSTIHEPFMFGKNDIHSHFYYLPHEQMSSIHKFFLSWYQMSFACRKDWILIYTKETVLKFYPRFFLSLSLFFLFFWVGFAVKFTVELCWNVRWQKNVLMLSNNQQPQQECN